MISMYIFEKVRELLKQDKTYTEIAKELNIHRKTVAKYARQNTPPCYRERKSSGKVDFFNGLELGLKNKLEELPNWSCDEAFEWLKMYGYKGSLRTVERKVRLLRGAKSKERFFDQEFSPAQQSQFDFKEKLELPFINGLRQVNMHFGTLPFSDVFVMKGYPQKNFECFLDGIHSFFESIGGMTKVIRIDNLSPCVKEIGRGTERGFTKAFTAAIKYYDFEVSCCSPGRGNEKGDVERDIQTHTRRFLNYIKLNGIVFKSFFHLNLILEEYFKQDLLKNEKYQEEVKLLKPQPCRDEDVLCRIIETKSTPSGLIKFENSFYSVPDSVIGINCRIIGSPFDVKIIRLDTKQTVCVHNREEGKNQIKLEHVITSLLRKPRAMINWAHKEVLFPKAIFKKYFIYLKKLHEQGVEKEYLRMLNLIHHATLKDLEVAMELVLTNKSLNPFQEIKELIFSSPHGVSVLNITEKYNQEKVVPDLSGYDELIPNKGG